MKSTAVTLGLVVGLIWSATAYAQQKSADPLRVERKQEARQTARNHTVGEGNPIPEKMARVPRAERKEARADRRVEGAAAARAPHLGEGNPVPEPSAKIARPDRVQARALRKAESRRANKSGEITSKGEVSY